MVISNHLKDILRGNRIRSPRSGLSLDRHSVELHPTSEELQSGLCGDPLFRTVSSLSEPLATPSLSGKTVSKSSDRILNDDLELSERSVAVADVSIYYFGLAEH